MKDNKSLHNDYYYYNIVRINIKKHRKMANLTQQQLADKIDVSMHYISQIESANPNKYFTLVVIGRIADALNIDIKELFAEEVQNERSFDDLDDDNEIDDDDFDEENIDK